MGWHSDSRLGNSWTTETTSPALLTVWGPPGGPVWAAGAGGVLFRRGTSGWAQEPLPPAHPLYGLNGSSSTNVYAVGDTGTILHYNGTAWSPQASPRNVLLRSVWTAESGAGLHRRRIRDDPGLDGHGMGRDGESHDRPSCGTCGDCRPATCYAVGDSGIVLNFDGSRWNRMTTPDAAVAAGHLGYRA